jgi:uncharacterized protein (DUF1499 family)
MKIKIFVLILLQGLTFIGCSVADQTSQGNKVLAIAKNNNVLDHLKPCPSSPNCINTEYPDDESHYLPPLSFSEQDSELVKVLAKQIILNMGGKIIEESGDLLTDYYIHAIFTSSLFKFVDDFEIRINNETKLLSIRSASRVGYSDFGVNMRRVKEFSKQFDTELNSKKG